VTIPASIWYELVLFFTTPISMPAAFIIFSTIKMKYSVGTIIFEVPVVMIAYGYPSLKVKAAF